MPPKGSGKMKEFASNSIWEEAFIQVQQEVLMYGTNFSLGCEQIIKIEQNRAKVYCPGLLML